MLEGAQSSKINWGELDEHLLFLTSRNCRKETDTHFASGYGPMQLRVLYHSATTGPPKARTTFSIRSYKNGDCNSTTGPSLGLDDYFQRKIALSDALSAAGGSRVFTEKVPKAVEPGG